MRKITKKQIWIINAIVVIGLIVLGITLPNNVMEYSWAKTFVGTISPIVPMAENFANNPHAHPIMPVYYGAVGLAFYVLFIAYFFAEDKFYFREGAKPRNGGISRRKLIFNWWYTIVFGLICLIWTLSMFARFGVHQADGDYNRINSLLMFLPGAVVFGSFLFPISMNYAIHLCFRNSNKVKQQLDEEFETDCAQLDRARELKE